MEPLESGPIDPDSVKETTTMPRTRYTYAYSAALVTLFLFGVSSAWAQHYQRTDLTADNSTTSATAPNIDPSLVNAWGMARGSGSPWWISDNGTSLTTLYLGDGSLRSIGSPACAAGNCVGIPKPDGTPGGTPTGAVFNFTGQFNVGPSAPAIFLFVTEDGSISGWNPNVSFANTVVKVNRSAAAIYKGLAIAAAPAGARLYATNFKAGTVEVFNGKFQRVIIPGAFFDPNLPLNYAPFGIQNVGGNIVVTFAHRAPGSTDEDHGPGVGFVDVFDLGGRLVLRLKHGLYFNAPWGIALAPGDFGQFSHRLLIGNFGDGHIHAFNAITGKFEGTLLDSSGAPLWIDGLWGLSFGGDSTNNGQATELFFTAGPNDEGDGLLGKITPAGNEQRGNAE